MHERRFSRTGGPAHLDECRYDHLQRLLDHPEAVGIVQPQDVGAHEGEDGHDVVEDLLLQGDTFVCLFVYGGGWLTEEAELTGKMEATAPSSSSAWWWVCGTSEVLMH